MDTYTPALQRGFLALPTRWQYAPTAKSVRSEEDCAHAEANLREWRSYLPDDCINAMLQMGWDLST
jgi:hypothetical protein